MAATEGARGWRDHVGEAAADAAGVLGFAHARGDAPIPLPELNLETLEAETPGGTVDVQRADRAFVGEIADGRAIGIAYSTEVDIPPGDDEIMVRLYGRQWGVICWPPTIDNPFCVARRL